MRMSDHHGCDFSEPILRKQLYGGRQERLAGVNHNDWVTAAIILARQIMMDAYERASVSSVVLPP